MSRAIGTPFQQSLGLEWHLLEGDPPSVAVQMQLRENLCGPAGSLEGGVVSTLIDVAGASCAARALGSLVATQDMSISFLAPGRVGPIRATGTPLRVSSDHVVAEVKVIDLGNDDRLIAVALLTAKALRPRSGESA